MLDKTFEFVLFEEKENVGYITLNNPAQMNAVTAEVTRDLITCLEYCEQSEDIRCVVLRGAGGNFSAGGNVKAMKERLDKGINTAKAGIRIGGEFIMRLKTISKPTIAWIEGAAAGVGCSMAMACDFSIACEDSKFIIAFVNIGYVPDGGITYMLTKAAGPVKAMELMMSGKKFSGKEAAEWGIITEAVPAEEQEAVVQKYIKKYSAGPSVAYAQIKKLMLDSCYHDLTACMQNEVTAQYICSRSSDHYEAVSAFCEKRKPNFSGK